MPWVLWHVESYTNFDYMASPISKMVYKYIFCYSLKFYKWYRNMILTSKNIKIKLMKLFLGGMNLLSYKRLH